MTQIHLKILVLMKYVFTALVQELNCRAEGFSHTVNHRQLNRQYTGSIQAVYMYIIL